MKKWIVAVSGGVDSCVMLHQLVKNNAARFVVVHVDHGMRPESGEDAVFVENLAAHYGLPVESTQLKLGSAASEALAREKRWEFLRAMAAKHQADAVATAHHADDIVETTIINIVRGTGWRGIVSLMETDEIRRPLLGMRKRDILRYAQDHGLSWREDVTNRETTYLRNRVRANIMPRIDDEAFAKFIQLYQAQVRLRGQIETELTGMTELNRYELIMWLDEVAREVLRNVLGALPRAELERVLLFARTAHANRKMPLSNGRMLKSGVKQLIVLDGHD